MSAEPWQLAWGFAAAIFAIAKCASLIRAWKAGELPPTPRPVLAAWLLAWPGMEPERDLRRRRGGARIGGAAMAAGWLGLGACGLVLAASLPERRATGLLAAVSCVLVLHFGILRLLAVAWSAAGYRVRPVMDAPGLTPSLSDLWGRRWNSAFAALARRFVVAPLAGRVGGTAATWGAFVVSGLVHEIILSVPAGGGWGGPLAYFLAQGAGVQFERSPRGRALGLGTGTPRARAFAIGVALLPIPLLLNQSVLTQVALPSARAMLSLGGVMNTSTVELALWLAVLAHACVILAGVQVPRRLNWREELSRLSRFNRRLVWVYHAFIGFIVVAFGALTAALHDEMLRGDRAAVALAVLIGTFWTARLVVDFVVYRSEDWPRGRAIAVGHALLVAAFAGMSFTYWTVVARSVSGSP